MRRFGISVALLCVIGLFAILLVACGQKDQDVLPNPPPSTETPAPEPTPTSIPAPEPTPPPAPVVASPTPIYTSNSSRVGLNAEGLPQSEARAKAAEYRRNPPSGFGYLSVVSTPPDAYVYLDSARVGITPLTHYKTKVKSYTLRVDLPGYDTYDKTIYIHDDEQVNVTVSLTAATGTQTGIRSHDGALALTTVPSGATIFIDNTYKDVTPRNITGLFEGTHNLMLRKTGYKEVQQTFTITAGRTTALTVTMHTTT